MSEYLDKAKVFIGKTGPVTKNVIELGNVKQYAIATCEANPLYYDEEYAKIHSPNGKVMAPATIARTFDMPPVPDLPLPIQGHVHTEQEYKFIRPIYVGDVVYTQTKIHDIYEKEGKIGKMLFCVQETVLKDEKGDPFQFIYTSTMMTEASLSNPDFYKPLPSSKVDYKPAIAPLNPNAIKAGDKVEKVRFPNIDKVLIAQFGGASGNFNPIHFLDEDARAAGLPGVIAHGMISLAITNTIINAWMDGKGRLDEFKTRFTSMVYPNDNLSFNAEITSVSDTAEGKKVSCDISILNQKGTAVLKGTAVMIF